MSDEWITIPMTHVVKSHDSNVESHNAISVGWRNHSYLRQISLRIFLDSLGMPQELVFFRFEGKHDMSEPDSLSPALPVFGVVPGIPVRLKDLLNHVVQSISCVLLETNCQRSSRSTESG